ncbi:hypothetical protein Hypma_014709 [Hypsizygus marmoreus]|uniref:Uncharacterized protein n=1 Tax=Hypsizygus marmoreus TaxID=39966 RepID=A0A369J924_HYPMA|nr:hypothetical protein Hypma_014709 [Hypsizygus marmoreus]
MPYPTGPLTGKEIRKVARATITTLAEEGLDACLFGSAACAIYGMENREPNDIDVVVLTDQDPEEIKDLLISNNDKFFLVPSRNPQNTYQVLWFTLPSPRFESRTCKVDILIPGLLSIPNIPTRRLEYIDPFHDIPVVPLLALLLLKLRGWTDHLIDSRAHMRNKVEEDEEDIDEMLHLAVEEYGVNLRTEKWMPRWFVREARERVRQYVETWPDSADRWSELGFSVE